MIKRLSIFFAIDVMLAILWIIFAHPRLPG